MFAAALATLRKLAQNPRHVGSRRVGGTGVLHTWGRTLCYHGIVPK
jgi:lipoate-protein ligase A